MTSHVAPAANALDNPSSPHAEDCPPVVLGTGTGVVRVADGYDMHAPDPDFIEVFERSALEPVDPTEGK